MPKEATNLRERNATDLLADPWTLDRVVQGMMTTLGQSYVDCLHRFQDHVEALGPEATAGRVLDAAGAGEAASIVRLLEAHADHAQRTLDGQAPLAKNDTVYAGQIAGLPEPVLLPDSFDHGKMANPEERARRLARARANDVGGLYVGDQGAERFHAEDKRAVETGWDLPRSLERKTEVDRARASAKNETGAGARAVERTQAARTAKRSLEQEIGELDAALVTDEAQAEDAERRNIARPPGQRGRLLERRQDLTKQLAKAEKDETLQLESIPAYSFVAKQVVKDERQSDLDKKLLGPDGPSPGARDLHEDVKRYMLENDVPAEKYVDALHTVAGED